VRIAEQRRRGSEKTEARRLLDLLTPRDSKDAAGSYGHVNDRLLAS
jgi:hypothetical protein